MTINEHDENTIQIIKGCIIEDRRSQKDLYKLYHALALGICLRYSNDKEEALAILNDGFFKVFKHIKKYNFDKPISAWIRKIMTNTAIDYYRSKVRMGAVVDIASYEHPITDETITQKLHYEDLLLLVQKLSPTYRTVFNLYAIDGYTHEEIGSMLGIAVGTSKSNLHKARQRLAEMVRNQNSIAIKS